MFFLNNGEKNNETSLSILLYEGSLKKTFFRCYKKYPGASIHKLKNVLNLRILRLFRRTEKTLVIIRFEFIN